LLRHHAEELEREIEPESVLHRNPLKRVVGAEAEYRANMEAGAAFWTCLAPACRQTQGARAQVLCTRRSDSDRLRLSPALGDLRASRGRRSPLPPSRDRGSAGGSSSGFCVAWKATLWARRRSLASAPTSWGSPQSETACNSRPTGQLS
jgi:hypothetical protein